MIKFARFSKIEKDFFFLILFLEIQKSLVRSEYNSCIVKKLNYYYKNYNVITSNYTIV